MELVKNPPPGAVIVLSIAEHLSQSVEAAQLPLVLSIKESFSKLIGTGFSLKGQECRTVPMLQNNGDTRRHFLKAEDDLS